MAMELLLADNNFDNIAANMGQLLSAAQRCLAERQILPCLTLLYAGMDVMSFLESAPAEKVNVHFKRWVQNNLLPLTNWTCTAVDLYAARCAVVHTFTAESDLSKAGKAKVILYAHSGADPTKLQKVGVDFGWDVEYLNVEDMLKFFGQAALNYLADMSSDPVRKAQVEKKAGLWFGDTKEGLIDKYLTAKAMEEQAEETSRQS
jgi:hypothetical protein